VAVDEAGRRELAAAVDPVRAAGDRRRGTGPDRRDAAVRADDVAVGDLAPGRVDGRDRAAFDDGRSGGQSRAIYSLAPIAELLDIEGAGRLGRDEFTALFGGVFEASPWIAAAAWERRPFADVAALHAALVAVVDAAPEQERLALIRAHPDLAGRAAIAGELTDASQREQAAAGLDRLTPEQYERIAVLTAAYRERFGFPFVVCAREHGADSIIAAAERRLGSEPAAEQRTALAEIAKIARLRLDEIVTDRTGPRALISYGKLEVPVHCVGVTPLRGLPAVPESPLRALDSGLLACEVSMEVLGQGFLAAYTEGDNSRVVATDTMKNVILRRALEHDGATLEGFLDELGRGFLGTYPDMEGLRLRAVEQPFEAVAVGARQARSDRLFALHDGDRGIAELELERGADGGVALVAQRSGRIGLKLLKTTGSAFTRFARDESTTLPERSDRPLFIHLDVHWRYSDPVDALARDPGRYVAPAQVRDVVATVFHEFVSESIQHLVHEMGRRLLERYPALAEVSFAGQNHTHDPVPGSDPEASRRAYTAAFPAWGLITLTLGR
jgi:urate oxidase / 2-oxo-4-hydroxy-4-carboxy-5-ureidoimidazoline decarboxylase